MWWLLFACAGNIQALYQAERDLVLAAPASAATDWQPEIRFRMGGDALGSLAQEALDAGLLSWKETLSLDNPLGIRCDVTPRIEVDKLDVEPTDACEGCLELSARLSGKARWRAGKLSGDVPIKASVKGTLAMRVDSGKQGWTLSGQVVDLDRLRVNSTLVGKLDLTKHLSKWTTRALEKVPRIEFGRIGGAKLPIRAMRLVSDSNAIEVQALSEVSGGAPVSTGTLAPGLDWQLRISQQTVLAMMRVAAFEHGAGEYEVAADPRSLSITRSELELGLRLWRLSGAGWWREYTVLGQLSLKAGELHFRSQEAIEGEKSPGAKIVDPLATLAEGKILEAVAGGIREAVPVNQSSQLQGLRVEARAKRAMGRVDALVVTGDFEVQGQAKR